MGEKLIVHKKPTTNLLLLGLRALFVFFRYYITLGLKVTDDHSPSSTKKKMKRHYEKENHPWTINTWAYRSHPILETFRPDRRKNILGEKGLLYILEENDPKAFIQGTHQSKFNSWTKKSDKDQTTKEFTWFTKKAISAY